MAPTAVVNGTTLAAAPTALVAANVALGTEFVIACLTWLAPAFGLGRRWPDPHSPGLAVWSPTGAVTRP